MTLKQVAKRAGVSHTTVSLVINNAKGTRVSPSTRQRVLEAIKELDYNPNLTAKRLASGKTNSIGLFIPFEIPIFRNYTIIEMVAGVQDILNERGFDLVLFSGGRNLYRDRPITQIVKQNTVDGLIIFNTRYTTPDFVNSYIEALNAQDFNYVILHYYWGKANVNYVGVDYEGDAYKATSHLLSLGHRTIALIAGTLNATVTSKIVDGYGKALHEVGTDQDRGLIVYADYDYELAYEKTRQLIRKHPSITSFIIGGYEMAPACLKAVRDSGLDVPREISIVCIIDSEIMPLLDPPMTAVKLPYYEMGRQAATVLLGNEKDKKRVLFESEMIIRGSTSKKR